ncbi:MAG: hypothetical protein ABR867_06555 [Nitrososphaerales archaeon]
MGKRETAESVEMPNPIIKITGYIGSGVSAKDLGERALSQSQTIY